MPPKHRGILSVLIVVDSYLSLFGGTSMLVTFFRRAFECSSRGLISTVTSLLLCAVNSPFIRFEAESDGGINIGLYSGSNDG